MWGIFLTAFSKRTLLHVVSKWKLLLFEAFVCVCVRARVRAGVIHVMTLVGEYLRLYVRYNPKAYTTGRRSTYCNLLPYNPPSPTLPDPPK